MVKGVKGGTGSKCAGAGWLLLVALAAGAPEARAEPAPCLAEATVEPARAVAGQQVLYRVRILRRGDVERVRWRARPAFPDLRAEWLPGRAEDRHEQREGARYAVREEHRALFPERPGRLELPGFELACLSAGRPELRLAVPPVVLEVVSPPPWDRPPEWQGTVGPVQLQVAVDRKTVALGESVRVSVLMRGDGNLWSEPPPFPPDAFGDAEVFRRRPELDLQPGSRLYVRRIFRLDVVPRRAGPLTVPALAVPYFDPEEGVYAFARSQPIPLRIEPRAVAAAAAPGPGRPEAGGQGRWGLAAGGALLLALTALLWRRLERRRRAWLPVSEALDAARGHAERGETRREATALARALRVAVAQARPPLPEDLQACTEALDRARFSAAGAPVDAERVSGLIATLRR